MIDALRCTDAQSTYLLLNQVTRDTIRELLIPPSMNDRCFCDPLAKTGTLGMAAIRRTEDALEQIHGRVDGPHLSPLRNPTPAANSSGGLA